MQRLTNNWTLKLTALILAIALWSHVRGEVNPFETATYSVHLNVEVPNNLRVINVGEIPREIRVTLRAPRSVFRQVNGLASPLGLPNAEESKPLPGRYGSAKLDFSLARPGKIEVPVRTELRLPPDTEQLGVNPSNVALVLDKQ